MNEIQVYQCFKIINKLERKPIFQYFKNETIREIKKNVIELKYTTVEQVKDDLINSFQKILTQNEQNMIIRHSINYMIDLTKRKFDFEIPIESIKDWTEKLKNTFIEIKKLIDEDKKNIKGVLPKNEEDGAYSEERMIMLKKYIMSLDDNDQDLLAGLITAFNDNLNSQQDSITFYLKELDKDTLFAINEFMRKKESTIFLNVN